MNTATKWVDIWVLRKLTIMQKRFYYWLGMFDWICALTADCLTCQNNKPKPKHRNEIPLEEWQNETVPFRTIHIDHKGPLHPPSNWNLHCLLVIDGFSRFLMYTQLLIMVLRLQSPPSKNGYNRLNFSIYRERPGYCLY